MQSITALFTQQDEPSTMEARTLVPPMRQNTLHGLANLMAGLHTGACSVEAIVGYRIWDIDFSHWHVKRTDVFVCFGVRQNALSQACGVCIISQ